MSTYNDDYKMSMEDPELFWMRESHRIPWYQVPERALSIDDRNFYRWYENGSLNICEAALDHHVRAGRGEQKAIIWESPVTGQTETRTYQELLGEVSKFADGLRQIGLDKGDRVIIYMPMIPQAAIAMLACARIGAIHSVVFGGFAPHELAIRIDDAQPKVILTATSGVEINKVLAYKSLVDESIRLSTYKPDRVVVFNRNLGADNPIQPWDTTWEDVMTRGNSSQCERMSGTDPLYILYTSGTTGKPKGIIREHGGYAVALHYSMERIYGVGPGDTFWAASDVGWVVGHSYIVYGPLLMGCTTIMYEGKPIKTPDAGSFWRIIKKHKVNSFFTAPTAIRAIRKEDPNGELLKNNFPTSLKYFFLAGERCDLATFEWLKEMLNIPIIDHWWQTESGWPMIAGMMGYSDHCEIKAGSSNKPVCGYKITILRPDGTLADKNEEGLVAIKLPLPPGVLPTLWGNDNRFRDGYLKPFPGYYFSGDGGYIDEDGYVYITGRVDDIINVAGHRLSTSEMEEVVSSDSRIAECAVVGIHDDLKGQIPLAFIVLKTGISDENERIKKDIVLKVRNVIGPVASLKDVVVVDKLPKTRSGKILRKILREIADGKEVTPPSTIEDISVLPEIENQLKLANIGAIALKA